MKVYILLLYCASQLLAGQAVLSLPHRSLSTWPLPVPDPFGFPKTVADSALEAKKAGTIDSYAKEMCQLIADPKVQGSREFRDMNGVLLWPMMINVARAAYIYSPEVVELWGQVFSTCNSMGGMAAEGLGYGMAYIYAEGIVESIGLTKIMQSAYKQGQAAFNGDGCKALNSLLDVAAAVIKIRDAAANELHLVMQTYSPQLANCTPLDAEQKFKPYSIRGNIGKDKPKVTGKP